MRSPRLTLLDTESGKTLVQLLVSMVVFSMVMVGVISVWSHTQHVYFAGSFAAELQQGARVAIEQIAREIRLAGYDPCRYVPDTLPSVGGTPVSTTCAAAPGFTTRSAFHPVRDGVHPIQSFSVTGVQVRADRNADGDATDTPQFEDVTFAWDPGTQVLSRDTGSGQVELARNVTSFALVYHDAAGAVTANRDDIRLVRIAATLEDTFMGEPLAVRVQSDVRLRDR